MICGCVLTWWFLLRLVPVCSVDQRCAGGGLADGVVRIRAGCDRSCAVPGPGAVTRVFSLYVVQAGSACPA